MLLYVFFRIQIAITLARKNAKKFVVPAIPLYIRKNKEVKIDLGPLAPLKIVIINTVTLKRKCKI